MKRERYHTTITSGFGRIPMFPGREDKPPKFSDCNAPIKRGAPYGNKNAVGNRGGGAPRGRRNGNYRHGGYAKLYIEDIRAAKRKRMELARMPDTPQTLP